MTNEYAKADLANVLEEVQEQFRAIAEIQQARAQLTASATVRKLATVTVNANGTVIDTRFGPHAEDASLNDIAKAVTEAAQQAVTEVNKLGLELMAPVQERQARLPKLTDLLEGFAEIKPPAPVAPPVTMVPPGADADDETGSAAMEFSNVEAYAPDRGPGLTDTSW
ncbi:YbaB/EbfC family nucleoid-associated protein [Nocardia sp. XZ_19_385]|uniref:YbaB/EbfC family nucleoid-associated protein n=1 Tax=Nocardia sp. XZ_19_385 TaxID=2769488 RepID=UPI00188E5283|nr:YbaB/EbfC family nucleoid-associated protein [Nocardia sp. XZ_19_385]